VTGAALALFIPQDFPAHQQDCSIYNMLFVALRLR
jgi:hypothetical protein